MLIADGLFASFASASGLLVAVSGGPDSLALLALASDWSKDPGRPPVFSATFDHGFRAESAQEARLAAQVSKDLGIPHVTLHWEGARPATRIQERARAARYRALVAHAVAIGADVLLTAHHADDQAETILFRMMRGSSIGGLAGMSLRRRRGSVVHARPLLFHRKTELVALCLARGLPFVTDPSNSDPRFARTGLRALAATLEATGMDPEAFARLARRAARAEAALASAAGALREKATLAAGQDETRLDAALLAQAPEELALRVLTAEIARLGRRPRLEQADKLVQDLLPRSASGGTFRATLGGVLVDLGANAVLVICRERPRRNEIKG